MSDDDPIIDGRPLSSLKVTELREELEKEGLPTKGVKAVLQERLREFLNSPEQRVPKKENPIIAEYRAKQQIALAEARAADPRNKKIPTSEDQVTSSKPVEQKKAAPVVPVAEPVVQDTVQPAVEEEAQKESSSSSSSSSSSYTSSSSSEDSSRSVSPHEPAPVLEKEPPMEEGKEEEEEEETIVEQQEEETNTEEAVMTEEVVVQNVVVAEKAEQATEEVAKEEEVKKEAEVIPDTKENIEKKQEEVQVEEEQNNADVDELDYEDDEEKDGKEDKEEQQTSPETETKSEDDNERKEDKKKTTEEKGGNVENEGEVREMAGIRRRASSPSSRHPVSNIVHIRGLVRPFTERALKEEISKHGGEIEDFWMDKVKSHCFVKLTSEESTENLIKALNGVHWPESNPKQLSIVYENEDNMERYKSGNGDLKLPEVITIGSLTGKRAERLSSSTTSVLTPASASASASSGVLNRTSLKSTLENVVRDNSKRDTELKEKRGSLASRLTRIEDVPPSAKETERKRQRSETPPFSRGAGLVEEKRGRLDGDRLRRDDRREREPVLKTPDELFKKTTTLPAIYYMPLTEAQVAQKLAKKDEKKSDSDRTRRRERH